MTHRAIFHLSKGTDVSSSTIGTCLLANLNLIHMVMMHVLHPTFFVDVDTSLKVSWSTADPVARGTGVAARDSETFNGVSRSWRTSFLTLLTVMLTALYVPALKWRHNIEM